MPELPEVETVVRSVRDHLTGRRIESAQLTSPFVTAGDRKAVARRLEGRVIESVERRGKFIVIALAAGNGVPDPSAGTLLIHLGMTGRLLVGPAAEAADPHDYGVFHLDHAAESGRLVYRDPRQFGTIEWFPGVPARIARLGPEPLQIPLDEFLQRLKRRGRIKSLLLNQAFLAGLGNIYVDESLFAAGIHPLAEAQRISRPRASRLHTAIQGILAHAIRLGGSSISDYVDGRGEKGWFQVEHRVYGREGEPCKTCGAAIRKILVVQRGTHYCAKCQRR